MNNKKLTNKDIDDNYSEIIVCLFPQHFTAALAYWITMQNDNEIIEIKPCLEAFSKYICQFYENPKIPEEFEYDKLKSIVIREVFENIPEIEKLNKLEPELIGLGALARNVFYMILREYITTIYDGE